MVMTVPVTIDPRYYNAVIFYLDGAAATDAARIDAAAWTQSADGVPLNAFRDNGVGSRLRYNKALGPLRLFVVTPA
jgi:hypothetical protein